MELDNGLGFSLQGRLLAPGFVPDMTAAAQEEDDFATMS